MTRYYDIYRFYNNIGKKRIRKPELIRSGISLEYAQKWCNDPTTKKEGCWFDGYQKA